MYNYELQKQHFLFFQHKISLNMEN